MANIIKAEKAQLACLDSESLQKKIDGYVRSAFRASEQAETEYLAARKARIEYAGEDKAELMRLKAEEKRTQIVCREKIADIDNYLQEQMALFSSKGLDPNRAYKEAIVPTGKYLADGNTEIFRIIVRGETLEHVDDDDENEGVGRSVKASRSYSERMGAGRERRRGKYGDGDMLIEQAAASIDASEVQSAGCACL